MHERYTLPLGQFPTPRFIFHEPVYAVSQDPNDNGTPASPPWWQSVLAPVVTTGLTIGTAFAQRELFGQTPALVQTPGGPVTVAGTVPKPATPPWLWPALIGGGLLLYFTLNKRRRR